MHGFHSCIVCGLQHLHLLQEVNIYQLICWSGQTCVHKFIYFKICFYGEKLINTYLFMVVWIKNVSHWLLVPSWSWSGSYGTSSWKYLEKGGLWWFYGLIPASCSLGFPCVDKDVLTQVHAPAVKTCLPVLMDSPWNRKPKQALSFISCFWSWCLFIATEKSLIYYATSNQNNIHVKKN